jgi:hypothetical protein
MISNSRTANFLRAAAAATFSLALAACGGSSDALTGSTTPATPAASDPLQFSAANYPIAQNAGTVSLTVTRTGATTAAVSVGYATVAETAIAGTDYTSTVGTLQWAANDATAKTISVPISNATPFSGTKTFSVELSDAQGGASIGTPATATVTINGSVAAAEGSLQFSAATYTVTQGAGPVTVTVNRNGSTSGAVSVEYATSSGTAVSGTDFTATSGTLNWAAGDAAAKTFSVPISTATAFSGTKSFTVALSGPSGGATVGSPGSASVTITGSVAPPPPTGAPSAVTNFQVTGQGQNSVSLSWTAAAAGANPVASYKIYRNGVAYATATGTTYVDAAATNVTTPGYGPQPYIPATVYSYNVSAVDSAGNEGPQAANCTAWAYHNGVDNWTMQTNNYSGGLSFTTTDTAGAPASGTQDIAITISSAANWWQPFSGEPFLSTNPTFWAMELGMFKYMVIDLKPTRAGQTWNLNLISRVTIGDNFNSANVTLGAGQYGPVAQVGVWGTYKIPLVDLAIGFGQYMGLIAGTTMTVTELISGIDVQGSSYLSGTGIVQGTANSTGTYVGGTMNLSGGLGVYPISPSQTVALTTITAQRTNLYKMQLDDGSGKAGGGTVGTPGNVYYVDNIGFTTN